MAKRKKNNTGKRKRREIKRRLRSTSLFLWGKRVNKFEKSIRKRKRRINEEEN